VSILKFVCILFRIENRDGIRDLKLNYSRRRFGPDHIWSH
jgi:hypothetical protein